MVQNETVQITSCANFKAEEDEAVRLRSELKITTLRSFETTSSSFLFTRLLLPQSIRFKAGTDFFALGGYWGVAPPRVPGFVGQVQPGSKKSSVWVVLGAILGFHRSVGQSRGH